MLDLPSAAELSEPQFAALVDMLATDPARSGSLTHLLCEDHPYYTERSAAAIVRMRGWVLLALGRIGISDRELPFVVEELDTGMDAYLVAAAARALPSYTNPSAVLVPFLMRALANVRDEPLSLECYGEYATSDPDTSPMRELFRALAWLGPRAQSALPELMSMREQPGRLSRKLVAELDRAVTAIAGTTVKRETETDACCKIPTLLAQRWWVPVERQGTDSIDSIVLEDHDGELIRYRTLFLGKPSVVSFFYTRCDNPWKCSLTVAKLARVQRLLEERGLANRIQTAAITYDPGFDTPQKMRQYGQDRGMRLDAYNRMLRTKEGFAALCRHFHLGVNFGDSVVSRHRIEIYVLDGMGRIAASFERVHWQESDVVERALEALREEPPVADRASSPSHMQADAAVTFFGTLASVGWAFFPKCPMCWAAYLSVLGMVGIGQIPYPAKMEPVLLAAILINLASVWFRARAIRRMSGFYLVSAGTLMMLLAKTVAGCESMAAWGVTGALAGSIWSVVNRIDFHRSLRKSRLRTPDRVIP
jgi:protein SCO1/2